MTNKQLLGKAAKENGHGTVLDMLKEATFDSVVPSICKICGETGEDVEPDAENYQCDHRKCNTRSSVLIIAGLI